MKWNSKFLPKAKIDLPTTLLIMLLRTLIIFLSASILSFAQKELPNAQNTFHILAVWEPLVRSDTTEEQIRHEMDRLLVQFGKGNRFNRVGFSFIYPAGKPEMLRRAARLAAEKGLVLGPIIGLQSHGNAGMAREFTKDLRNYMWTTNGRMWADMKRPDKPFDWHENLPPFSSSRYCDVVRKELEKRTREQARDIIGVMKEFPGVIAVVNPLIEQGMMSGKKTENGTLVYGDAGPYALTEFRDWLRHSGRYEDGKGAYAGQGAPPEITGQWVKIGGKLRSPFFDDTDPADANKTGKSFNVTFGTLFKSWSLRYFDLSTNPASITDPKTEFRPENGSAFVEGGFELPAADPLSAFWRAWIWVNQEQGGQFPPGNPKAPAYGFSQVMSRNYVTDVFGWLIEEGLPKDRLYAHQVPTEALGDSPMGLRQARTMAMGIWTGYVPACETVGITKFGHIDPKWITQYAKHWGIFEWHPQPGAAPDAQRLYDAAKADLEEYSANGCRFLFPGWWFVKGRPQRDTATFPLPDSRFADAIRDFLAKRPEIPVK
jgi:hypothetical protein